jgi:hypothetical protein
LTLTLCFSWLGILSSQAAHAAQRDIELAIHPQVCTLSRGARQCETKVQATWDAMHPESLCLIVLERKDVKQCWEHFASGTDTVQLTFADDLTFQLRDPQLHEVLASEVLRVIREAIRYRQRRRDVWDIFD